jgi:hypothetical protein
MLGGPDGAITDVFRKVPDVRKDLSFRDLGQAGVWVNAEKKDMLSVASTGIAVEGNV